MEASPTLRQPLRLSCLRKPPQRLEMFSTTRPWETQGQRESERERWTKRWTEPQDRGSAVTSQSAPKPTDPALSLGLDNATQQAHTCSTYRQAHTHKYCPFYRFALLFFSLINTPLTSMSVWKLNKSIFCQLLPSRARTFHAWEGDRQVVDRDRHVGQTEVGEGEWELCYQDMCKKWMND